MIILTSGVLLFSELEGAVRGFGCGAVLAVRHQRIDAAPAAAASKASVGSPGRVAWIPARAAAGFQGVSNSCSDPVGVSSHLSWKANTDGDWVLSNPDRRAE